MDLGGFNLVMVEIVGVAALGIILLYMVLRTRSRGKKDNSAADDRQTRQRYAEAEADTKSHREEKD
jgi:hypothetical protein